MGQKLEGIEKGIRIYRPNSDTEYVDNIFGSGLPGGDAGEQDDAPLGSIYIQQNGSSSKIFQKQFATNAASDWVENSATAVAIGSWRSEKVSVVTNDTQGAGVRDVVVSPFADDEVPLLLPADFIVGEFIISDADGTPVLLEITDQTANNVTFALAALALVADDTFVARNYLPDSPDSQENEAIVNYNGSIIIKLADIDWNIADGINLNGSITDRNGPVSGTDTVQVAIEKLEGDAKDNATALGIARGALNFGAFAIGLIASSLTLKPILQRIETMLGQLRGVKVTGVTLIANIDTVPHASVKTVKWLVEIFEEATPANREAREVYATTDGTLVDYNAKGILKLGANFDKAFSVDISGADMRLRVSSSTAGITATARRIEVVQS